MNIKIIYNLITQNVITDSVSTAVSSIAENTVITPIVNSCKNVADNYFGEKNINIKAEESTVSFLKSITIAEFSKIQYSPEIESKLIEASRILFNNLSDAELKILKNNPNFKKDLGNLFPLFEIYCNNRNSNTYKNDNKYISTLLTGVPGTGKTVFMKMIIYLNQCMKKYTNTSAQVYFITGAFFLTKENEAKSMQYFISKLEKDIENGAKIILAIDECELIVRNKEKAPAVTLLLEFLSRISSSIYNNDKSMFMVMCSTNTSNNFDNAAFRRFKYTIVFNHVESGPLIKNMKDKIKDLFVSLKKGDIYKKMTEDILFMSIINAFFANITTVSFGEIDNIKENLKMYFNRFKDSVNENYNIILFLALIEYIKKESNLKNPGDKNALYLNISKFYYMIEEDIFAQTGNYINFKQIVELIFYQSGSLLTINTTKEESIETQLRELIKIYINL